VRIAANRSHGRSSTPARRITPDAIRARPATAPAILTSPVSTNRALTNLARKRGDERPAFFAAARRDRPQGDRPRFDRRARTVPNSTVRARRVATVRGSIRPREDRAPRSDWQEHPRSEPGERPRRDGEDDTKIFASARRSAGRGAYRERKPDERRPATSARRRRSPANASPRWLSRAGLCSRRRRRGVDRAGPRRRQWARDQFAGARRYPCAPSSPSTASRCRRPSAPGCFCSTSPRGLMTTTPIRKDGRRCSTICRKACHG